MHLNGTDPLHTDKILSPAIKLILILYIIYIVNFVSGLIRCPHVAIVTDYNITSRILSLSASGTGYWIVNVKIFKFVEADE